MGGVKSGPSLYSESDLEGFGPQFRREVDQVAFLNPLKFERRGFGRERLGAAGFLSRYSRLFDGPFLDGPDRLSGLAVEHVGPALFAGLHDGLDVASVDGDIHQDGRAWNVIVPDSVMDKLVVPDPFAGFQVDRDEGFRKQSCRRADVPHSNLPVESSIGR